MYRTFKIENGVTGHRAIPLERLSFQRRSDKELLKSVLKPHHKHTMDEFRRSAIRRLFLQSEYADKATRLLKQIRTQDFLSRQDILNRCPHDLKDSKFHNLLQDIGCAIRGYNEFHLLCEASGIYEYVTRDYADGLAKYIRDSPHEKILEVG